MADERVVVELALQGAQTTIREIQTVVGAQENLIQVIESSGVRQRRIYDTVAAAAAAAAQAEEAAFQQRAETIARLEEQTTSKIVAEAAKQADARRKAAAEAVAPQVQQQIRQATFPTPSNLTPQRLQVAVDAAQFTAARNAIIAQAEAAQTLQGRLRSLLSLVTDTASGMLKLGQSSDQAAQGLNNQSNATDNASKRSITYLSVLSAIHAASFLATNQTFSMVGSFATLTAAFGKVGFAAGVAGAGLAGLLGLFGVISKAIDQIQSTVIGGAQALLGLGTVATGAAVAAGTAGVKIAADVESQLAQVRAFGGATEDQLRQVSTQAGEFARKYGIAAADVVAATSLFARAGGTVEEAIQGATEAILKLQVASAGELSAAQAALLVSAALKQFNLAGDQSTRVADNITAAFQGSALSALGVQQAFIQAVPGAAALGLSIEDVSTAVALLGDQLIKGTTTGTAFKQFIIDVIKPSQQAQAVFRQYGIAIQDTNGEALPFIDVVRNLNAALGDQAVAAGEVTNLQREQALAIIFGSRAFLAANILTREGADGLEKYRAALAGVTTTNVVDILLLPLNKQLERAQINLQEVGRAFGGPLLEPIRSATVAAIQFFQGLLGPAELLGQAISSIATGQGFGQLQQNIAQLVGNNALASFFIELANSGRNIRDVIVNQIIPAIQDFVQTVVGAASSAAGLDQIGSAFDGIDAAIRTTGATIVTTIGHFRDLVVEMINNTGTGKVLRETIENLANTFLTHLVVGVTTTVTAISAAIQIMPTLARVSLLTAQAAVKLSEAFSKAAIAANNFGAGAQVGILTQQAREAQEGGNTKRAEELLKQADAVKKGADDANTALTLETDAARNLANELQGMIGSVDKAVASFKNAGKAPAEALAIARKPIEQIVSELIQKELSLQDQEFITQDQLDEFTTRAGAMKEAARQDLGGIITVADDLQGSISDAIANIAAEVAQAQREAQAQVNSTGGGTGVVPIDTKAIDAAQKRIAEAASDVQRRLANLEQDAEQKAVNVAARAIERIGDVLDKTFERVTEIVTNAEDRIVDLFRNVRERRADRDVLDAFKQQQEDRFTEWQRELDKEEQSQQRQLDHIRTDRQRDAEDAARSKEQEIQDNETVFSRLQAAAQRAFDRVAQAREVAFDRAQNAEATLFQRGLDREATARQNALDLANAKTPEDRARVLEQQRQAEADTKFRQGQEDRLTTFRQGQEDRKTKFTQEAESQSIAFRNGLEDKALQHRRDNELVLLAFRRNAENTERDTREAEEDAALDRRLKREDKITARRREDAKALQVEQDRIENVRNEEQAQRIRDEALKQVTKAVTEAGRQINEVIDSAQLALDEQAADTARQARNILDTLVDLKDNFPPEILAAVGDQLAQSLVSAGAKADDLKSKLEAIRGQKLGEIQIEGATATANIQLQAQEQLNRLNAPQATTIPIGVLAVQTIQAVNFLLPQAIVGQLQQSVLGALREADAENINLAGPDQQPDFTPLVDLRDGLNKWFGR